MKSTTRFRRLLAILLVALIAWPALAQPRADAPPARLKVASYNLENLLDVFDDPYTKDEETPVKPREQIAALAAAIRAMDADVLALQELENDGVLRAMVHEFLSDMGYQYLAVQPTNSDRGINLGVLSRRPIVSLTSYRMLDLTLEGETRSWRFARDLKQVRIQATPQRTLDLFIVHLKSRHSSSGDPQSVKWRLAEATAARRVIDGLIRQDPNAWVIVAGDFNDTPGSPGIAKFLEPSPLLAGRPVLHDMHAGLPMEQRITYLKQPFRNNGPIDYILASPDLARRLVPDSAGIILEPAELIKGSDHAPLFATFDLSGEP